MKKILLVIVSIMAIFQMVVLATDIDIGCEAIIRDYSYSGIQNTVVNIGNPANASGEIKSIKIYVASGYTLENVIVAIFSASGNNLTTHDTEALGNVSEGYHQFDVTLTVAEGNYLGFVADTTRIYMDASGGAGTWYKSGHNIPCEDVTFSIDSGWVISLYGTSITEEAEEEVNSIFFGCNF